MTRICIFNTILVDKIDIQISFKINIHNVSHQGIFNKN